MLGKSLGKSCDPWYMLFGICSRTSRRPKLWHTYVITYGNFMGIVKPWVIWSATSNFLKVVSYKFYLVHSWILCPILKSFAIANANFRNHFRYHTSPKLLQTLTLRARKIYLGLHIKVTKLWKHIVHCDYFYKLRVKIIKRRKQQNVKFTLEMGSCNPPFMSLPLNAFKIRCRSKVLSIANDFKSVSFISFKISIST